MLGSKLYISFYDEGDWDSKIDKVVKELNSLGIFPTSKTVIPPIPLSPPSTPIIQHSPHTPSPLSASLGLSRSSPFSPSSSPSIVASFSSHSPSPLSTSLVSSSSSSPFPSPPLSTSSPIYLSNSGTISLANTPPTATPTTLPATSWKVQEVSEWLEREGMKNIVEPFTREVIDGKALKELHTMITSDSGSKSDAHSMLKEMGLNIGDVLRFSGAIKVLF